jgi:hypothetical protein
MRESEDLGHNVDNGSGVSIGYQSSEESEDDAIHQHSRNKRYGSVAHDDGVDDVDHGKFF